MGGAKLIDETGFFEDGKGPWIGAAQKGQNAQDLVPGEGDVGQRVEA